VGFHRAEDAEERGAGICRTCLAPIWFEKGEIGGRSRTEPDWSDRIKRGGDSLVCFKAVEYRHVPLNAREAAIYDRAYVRGVDHELRTTACGQRVASGDAGALRKVAEAATPGPWRAVEGDLEGKPPSEYLRTLLANREQDGTSTGRLFLTLAPNDIDPERGGEVVPATTGDGPRAQANAAHIATFDPPTVLALLDRLEAAEAKVARVTALEPTWHRGMYGCPDDMFSRSAIRAALTEETP
jgi:hypothetical protein